MTDKYKLDRLKELEEKMTVLKEEQLWATFQFITTSAMIKTIVEIIAPSEDDRKRFNDLLEKNILQIESDFERQIKEVKQKNEQDKG